MRIAVIGAGAVGSILGSLLWRAGYDVTLVGRAAHVAAIRAAGLDVRGVLGGFKATPRVEERLGAKADLVLLTVKTQDIVATLRDNAAMLEGTPIVLVQNGLSSEKLAATVVEPGQLVSAVVSLHAEYLVPGRVAVLQSEGILVGRPDGNNDDVVRRIREVLARAVPTSISANVRGARWTKLIANLNNVLPAVTNLTFRQVYADRFLRRVALGLMHEGIRVAKRAGVRLEPLPGTSLPLVRLAARLPAMLAGVLAARKAAQLATRGPVKGCAWQSMARARPTEIDYLNGEVVRAGSELGVPTPLNEFALALERRAASERRFLTAREIERAFHAIRCTRDRCRRAAL